MKKNGMLLVMAALVAGAVIVSCGGTPAPVTPSGQVEEVHEPSPAIDTAPKKPWPNPLTDQASKPSWLPWRNPNGSWTLFTIGDARFGLAPAQMRSRGARLPAEVDAETEALLQKYQRAHEADPQDNAALVKLAMMHINRGEPGDAERALAYADAAVQGTGGAPEAFYVRALAYCALGEYRKAVADLQSVLDSGIDDTQGIYYLIGVIEYQEGHVEEAIAAFEKVGDSEFIDTGDYLQLLYRLRD